MYKKNCPYCKEDSYSAASRGRWECPHCSADLTVFVPQPAGSVKDGHDAGDITPNPDAGSARGGIGKQVRNKLVLLVGGKKQDGFDRQKNSGRHGYRRSFRNHE